MHLNRDYIKNGPLDLAALFVMRDCTEQVRGLATEIEDLLGGAFSIQKLSQPPNVLIGPHCGEPVVCPMVDQCWGSLPEYNVTELYAGRRKGFALLAEGIGRMVDIPASCHLTERQKIQRSCISSRKQHVSKSAVKRFLDSLGYDHLEIRDGATASQEFLRITFGQVSPEERQTVRARLLAYCSQDTVGMVEIIRALENLVSS